MGSPRPIRAPGESCRLAFKLNDDREQTSGQEMDAQAPWSAWRRRTGPCTPSRAGGCGPGVRVRKVSKTHKTQTPLSRTRTGQVLKNASSLSLGAREAGAAPSSVRPSVTCVCVTCGWEERRPVSRGGPRLSRDLPSASEQPAGPLKGKQTEMSLSTSVPQGDEGAPFYSP